MIQPVQQIHWDREYSLKKPLLKNSREDMAYNWGMPQKSSFQQGIPRTPKFQS
jgi:hypothetical protein